MGFLSKIFSGSVGGLVEKVGGVIDKFHLSGEEKQQFKIELETLLQKRDSEIEQTIRSEMQAKERVMVAELQQTDNYTKRARPTLVYVGLIFIFLVHVAFPIIAYAFKEKLPTLSLPEEFWWAWGGVCGTWIIGRSAEKRGVKNKAVSLITGS